MASTAPSANQCRRRHVAHQEEGLEEEIVHVRLGIDALDPSKHSSSSSSSRAAAATHSAGSKPARACRTPEEASRGGRSHAPTSAAPTSATCIIAACGLALRLAHLVAPHLHCKQQVEFALTTSSRSRAVAVEAPRTPGRGPPSPKSEREKSCKSGNNSSDGLAAFVHVIGTW